MQQKIRSKATMLCVLGNNALCIGQVLEEEKIFPAKDIFSHCIGFDTHTLPLWTQQDRWCLFGKLTPTPKQWHHARGASWPCELSNNSERNMTQIIKGHCKMWAVPSTHDAGKKRILHTSSRNGRSIVRWFTLQRHTRQGPRLGIRIAI